MSSLSRILGLNNKSLVTLLDTLYLAVERVASKFVLALKLMCVGLL